MKMSDGGTRPAYNVQFATDAKTRMIVGVDVTNQGTDMGQLAPMIKQVVTDSQIQPEQALIDGGFVKISDIVELETAKTKVFAPLPQEQAQFDQGKDPYAAKPGDDPQMAEFRKRMGTDSAKAIYKQRSSIAEFPNADCRNRGLGQFRVRGLAKVKAQILWHVWAFNFMRMLNLGCVVQVSR